MGSTPLPGFHGRAKTKVGCVNEVGDIAKSGKLACNDHVNIERQGQQSMSYAPWRVSLDLKS
jgi:hypothetical protein